MKLKATVKSLDDVPEQYQGLYTQVGDSYVLDIDETEYKTRLSEFRDNNIDLRQKADRVNEYESQLTQLTEQLANFKDLDPEKARAALEQMQALQDKQLIDAGKIDELLAQRTERMRTDYDAQLTAALEARDSEKANAAQYREKLSSVVIDSSLQTAIGNVATVRKGAIQDVLARGRSVWQLDKDGNPIPKKGDGTIMYGKDGEHAISMEEWGQVLVSEAPYLFEGNAGGGGHGNQDENGDHSAVNYGDVRALGDNLEGIADGTVEVVLEK